MNIAKRILVTGASKGIGKATAIMLSQYDFNITIHYHADKHGAQDTLEQIKSKNKQAQLLNFDINDRKTCRTILEEDIEKYGAYYGIVANAGISKDSAFPMMTEDEWDSVIDTNLTGFYNVLHPCVTPMIAAGKGGRIVTVSSISGLIGNRGQVNYSAAKAGIIGASKALAVELAKRKITVNCVAPGIIDTAMTSDIKHLEEIIQNIPVKRMGTVNEVASLICYLMSDMASYITRQVISINGGLR
jgi:3-oxoacyl-[acyl-carrier protein] reductase